MRTFLQMQGHHRRIIWGLWRTGNSAADFARVRLARLADANVFYSSRAADDFESAGVGGDRIWVARNTVRVDHARRVQSAKRNTLLCVGSFDARKQNDATVSAFHAILPNLPSDIQLVFVGDGSDKQRIIALASKPGLEDRVEFHPGTSDPEILRRHYDSAICSVSFGQAGLSVLQSFAYGVPYITKTNAISGGEIENVRDGFNGLLCTSEEFLQKALLTACVTPGLADRLGRNAFTYYSQNATVEHMANGFIGAIEGTPRPRQPNFSEVDNGH